MSASLFEPAPTGAVARVALPVPVDELFDYSLPPALEADAQPGCRVIVGFAGRHLTGVIAERTDHSAHEGKLRPIQKLIDTEPVVSPAMLRMLREEAREVFCPVGMAVAAALPAGSAPRVVRGYTLTDRGRIAVESGAARGETRALLDALTGSPLSAAAVRSRVRGMVDPTLELQALERDGLVARCNLERGPSARAARERVVRPAPNLQLEAALAKLARAPRQAALLARIATREETPVHELTPDFAPRLLQGLAERDFVVLSERAAPRNVLGEPLEADRSVELTPDQADALKPLLDAVERRHAETYLLHGVTGSGKTEVYLRAVGCALALGRQALVLVPEITLTHQIVARLRGRFGDGLAILHSGLRPGERLEQWQRLRNGGAPIAVGARSALFAPLENLGVIVMDEEHDTAYKNEEGSATTPGSSPSGAPGMLAVPSSWARPRPRSRCASRPTGANSPGSSWLIASGGDRCPPSRSSTWWPRPSATRAASAPSSPDLSNGPCARPSRTAARRSSSSTDAASPPR